MTPRTLTHGVHALPQHSSASGRAGGASASAFLRICFVRKGVRRSRLPYAATCARMSASLVSAARDASCERIGAVGLPADALSRVAAGTAIPPRRAARDESISSKNWSRASRVKRGSLVQRVRESGQIGHINATWERDCRGNRREHRWERSKSGPGRSGIVFFPSGRQPGEYGNSQHDG